MKITVSDLKNSLIHDRIWIVVFFLSLALILSIAWMINQEKYLIEMDMEAEGFSYQDVNTLINWELSRQLNILAIALTSGIALITIASRKDPNIPQFIAGSLIAILNIFSLSKLVQSFQFVIHYEQYVAPQIYTQVHSKWDTFYGYFFQLNGKLNQSGLIITVILLSIITFLWIFLLNSVKMKSLETNNENTQSQN